MFSIAQEKLIFRVIFLEVFLLYLKKCMLHVPIRIHLTTIIFIEVRKDVLQLSTFAS